MLLWFIVLSSLISLVIIRIVVVTAVSYGLSQYALEMVVRVLVLELIPLTAVVFAALRCALPNAAEILEMRMRGEFDALAQQGIDRIGFVRLRGGAIDPDDCRTHVGQHHGAERRRTEPRKFDDPDSL